MPTSARARGDLPEPLGPTTATALPARSAKLTSCSTTASEAGAVRLIEVTRTSFFGAGKGVNADRDGTAARASASWPTLARTAMKLRQLAIASSIGASARIERLVAASMTRSEEHTSELQSRFA